MFYLKYKSYNNLFISFAGEVDEVSWFRNPNSKIIPPSSSQLRLYKNRILRKRQCETRYTSLSRDRHRFKLGGKDACMVEEYSGGSSCDRENGGGVFCKDAKGLIELCGVQVFRLCDFSLPKIITDLSY